MDFLVELVVPAARPLCRRLGNREHHEVVVQVRKALFRVRKRVLRSDKLSQSRATCRRGRSRKLRFVPRLCRGVLRLGPLS
jgi:hypothetical protein